jgi:hypothetical protein
MGGYKMNTTSLFDRLIELRKVCDKLQHQVDYSKVRYRNSEEFRTYEKAQTATNECSNIIFNILFLTTEFNNHVKIIGGKSNEIL